MADKILVSTEELRSTSIQFKTYLASMESAYTTMSNAVTNLSGTWSGEASGQFIEVFSKMYENLKMTTDKMNDAADEMLKGADMFEDVENSVKARAESLEVGSSPFA